MSPHYLSDPSDAAESRVPCHYCIIALYELFGRLSCRYYCDVTRISTTLQSLDGRRSWLAAKTLVEYAEATLSTYLTCMTSPPSTHLPGYQSGTATSIPRLVRLDHRSWVTATSRLDCHQAREPHDPTACAVQGTEPFSRNGDERRPNTPRCLTVRNVLRRITAGQRALLKFLGTSRSTAASWNRDRYG